MPTRLCLVPRRGQVSMLGSQEATYYWTRNLEALTAIQLACHMITIVEGPQALPVPSSFLEGPEATHPYLTSVHMLQRMMQERSVPLGTHMYASLISACAIGESGSLSKRLQRAQRLHSQMLGVLLLLCCCHCAPAAAAAAAAAVHACTNIHNLHRALHCHLGLFCICSLTVA